MIIISRNSTSLLVKFVVKLSDIPQRKTQFDICMMLKVVYLFYCMFKAVTVLPRICFKVYMVGYWTQCMYYPLLSMIGLSMIWSLQLYLFGLHCLYKNVFIHMFSEQERLFGPECTVREYLEGVVLL